MALFGRKHVEEEEDVLDTSASVSQEDLPDLPEPPSSTVVASGTSITGTMKGEGIIQVEGVVEGEIDLKGAVIVAPSGLVSGPVTADVIRIAGRVEGVVSARGTTCSLRRPAASRAISPPCPWWWRTADGSTAPPPCPPKTARNKGRRGLGANPVLLSLRGLRRPHINTFRRSGSACMMN